MENEVIVADELSLDALDAMLDDLEIEETEDVAVEEVVEEPALIATDEVIEIEAETDEPELLDAEDVAALETSIAKSEIYEETAGEPETIEMEPVTSAAASKVKRTPPVRVARDVTTLPAEAFFLVADETPDDPEANKTAVLSRRPTQKKIAEKFDNTLAAIHAGKKPSTYVVDCFAVLAEKEKVTTNDLVSALKAHDYSEGTARSQVGQIMALFPVLGIAERSGSTLTLIETSALAAKLADLIVGSETTAPAESEELAEAA